MRPIVRLEKVTKRFGAVVALDEVSFEVPPGTVFALLGENGAGKSTCIRLMLGLDRPQAGKVKVFGLPSYHDSLEIRRRAGYVAERPTLYDWMTVDEIGWFTGGFYEPEFIARYRQLADQFRLPRQRKLKALSKGMRAKVALALALAPDPELLILDEPTSGLDAMVRREFLESMVDRSAPGKTVFLSSHQIHEVERVADVVAILRGGRLVALERLEKLKADTAEWTVTLGDPAAEPPPVTGELLRQRRRSRQWQLLVRGAVASTERELGQHPAVDEVQSRTPSLEEIFMAYMGREPTSSAEDGGERGEELSSTARRQQEPHDD